MGEKEGGGDREGQMNLRLGAMDVFFTSFLPSDKQTSKQRFFLAIYELLEE